MGNKKFLKFEIFSILFIWIMGTLLHFTFEWSNKNELVAAFSAVNESTWEHLKLVFFPMLITSIIGYFVIGKEYSNYWGARMLGIISAIGFVTIFYYTYTGIIGANYAVLDIGSFFVGSLIGEIVAYRYFIKKTYCNNYCSILTIALLLFAFITFTYYPPKINYFKDPIYNQYGIIKEETN